MFLDKSKDVKPSVQRATCADWWSAFKKLKAGDRPTTRKGKKKQFLWLTQDWEEFTLQQLQWRNLQYVGYQKQYLREDS